MHLEVNNNSSAGVGHNPQAGQQRKISFLRLFSVIIIVASLIAALVIFLIVPLISRAQKEAAYRQGIAAQIDEELMSIRLDDMIKLHYEVGNYDSVRPYIEETSNLYSDGYAKLEALSQVNVIFHESNDWSSLRQFYEYMLGIAKEYKLDEETTELFRNLVQEAKKNEQK